MSNKQARRKKHLRQKRIKSTIILLGFIILLILAVNGLIGLITGRGVESPSSSQVQSSGTDSQSDIVSEPEITAPQPNEYTTLVNVENPLTDDFEVETRQVTYNGSTVDKLFDVRAADQLEAMLNDAKSAGYPMYLVSTYRTIEYQRGLYNRKVNEYLNKGYEQSAAEAEAAKWVAIPGTSEHNLGLVADIVSSTWYNTNSDLEQTFEDTEHFTWLIEHCADYGFILRYPKGKEAVTGIVYEPWHYRYVGTEVAHYIMDNNLTLEEFWEVHNNAQS